MALHKLLAITALVAAAFGSASTAACPSLCTCYWDIYALCSQIGTSQPPPGYFPHITQLEYNYNNIERIGLHDFSGFPNLESLYIEHNPLTELDMNVFANHEKLRNLYISRNKIENITVLDPGVELPGLITLSMEDNAIHHLPSNFLDAFPQISKLDLGGNNIILPEDGPFVSSRTLEYLFLTGADATAISSETFSQLPGVFYLNLEKAKFSDIGDAFAYLPKLYKFAIGRSDLKAIRRGAFSKEQNIFWIDLENSQIEVIETAALDSVVTGRLTFDNSPLACECKYEALYWWSIARGIYISSGCSNGPVCQFTRKKFFKY